ncbi:MAG: DUF1192 family protein [Magnetospiraceae bacterium]
MDTDDLDPKPKQALKDLEVMSIEALNEYITELETEIARAQEMIERKKEARGAADSVFKF